MNENSRQFIESEISKLTDSYNELLGILNNTTKEIHKHSEAVKRSNKKKKELLESIEFLKKEALIVSFRDFKSLKLEIKAIEMFMENSSLELEKAQILKVEIEDRMDSHKKLMETYTKSLNDYGILVKFPGTTT